MRPMFNVGHDLASGGSIRTQLVGDHPLWRETLLPQKPCQQPAGSLGVAPVLNDFVEDISILIDGTPEPVSFTIDADNGFVQVPDIL